MILTEAQMRTISRALKKEEHLLLEDVQSDGKKAAKAAIREYMANSAPYQVKMAIGSKLDEPLETAGLHDALNPPGETTAMYNNVLRNTHGENRVIDFLTVNIFDQLGCKGKSGPWKYVKGASRILLFELGFYTWGMGNMRGGDIIKFAKTLRYITLFPEFFLTDIQLDKNLNGMSYEQFSEIFAPKMREFRQIQETRTSELETIHTHGYTIVRVPDCYRDGSFRLTREGNRILDELTPYTDWCICNTNLRQFEYPQYAGGGGAVYIMIKDGFKDIQKPADLVDIKTDKRPLDDYGLSLICVIVGADGLPDNVTTRYNHEYGGENNKNFCTPYDIKRLTGVDYFSVFKPREEEELRAAHMLNEDETPSAMDQVDNKVNAGVMDAVTGGGMMEGADPETDEYTIGSEGGNNDYFHVNEGKKSMVITESQWKKLQLIIENEGTNLRSKKS